MPEDKLENKRQITELEPKARLLDEGRVFRILIELPGIPEEKIKIELENYSTLITIVASDTSIHYKKVISIPYKVRFSKKRYSDEVLELILEKISIESL